MYEWVLREHGQARAGSRRSSTVAGAALRLARFNTLLEVADKRWFRACPSPAAAALVAGFVWIVDDLRLSTREPCAWWAWSVTVFAGLTMVSNLKYWSFKTINLQEERAVRGDLPDRDGRGAAVVAAAARAVRRLRRVRGLGLRRVRVARCCAATNAAGWRAGKLRRRSRGRGATPPCAAFIAVLVPCRNEAPTVAQVVADFRAALPGCRVYVYDNGSQRRHGRRSRATPARSSAASRGPARAASCGGCSRRSTPTST